MIEKNGRKFVTLGELAEFLNENVPAAETYRIPELAEAWADARAKFYAETGHKVKEGKHYLMVNGKVHLSEAGCALIECLALVDGHTVPVLRDGITDLFNP